MAYRPYRGRLLGARLRQLRGDLTLEHVALKAGGFTFSKLSRIENAASTVKPADLERLLDFYGGNGRLRDTDRASLRLLAGTPPRGWWQAFRDILPPDQLDVAEVEGVATAVTTWSLGALPVLLQTPGVARELIAAREPDGERAAALGQAHIARQTVLHGPRPPRLHAVMAEPALRVLGDLLREQADHLLQLAARPTITLQVVPTDRIPAVGRLGDFTLLSTLGTTLVVTGPPLGGPRLTDGSPYLAPAGTLARAALSTDESARLIARLCA